MISLLMINTNLHAKIRICKKLDFMILLPYYLVFVGCYALRRWSYYNLISRNTGYDQVEHYGHVVGLFFNTMK
jgi:hypothetical protein